MTTLTPATPLPQPATSWRESQRTLTLLGRILAYVIVTAGAFV